MNKRGNSKQEDRDLHSRIGRAEQEAKTLSQSRDKNGVISSDLEFFEKQVLDLAIDVSIKLKTSTKQSVHRFKDRIINDELMFMPEEVIAKNIVPAVKNLSEVYRNFALVKIAQDKSKLDKQVFFKLILELEGVDDNVKAKMIKQFFNEG